VSDELYQKLQEVLEWRRQIDVSDTYRHRVLTYGTNSDKLLLRLFDWLGQVAKE
jgi:hypothetical protein